MALAGAVIAGGTVRDLLRRIDRCEECGGRHFMVLAIPLKLPTFVVEGNGPDGERTGRFFTHEYECPKTGEWAYARRLP